MNDNLYGAPWGRSLWLVSAFCVSLCVGMAALFVTIAVWTGPLVMALASLIPLAVVVGVMRFRVLGYSLGPETIGVRRPAGDKLFDRKALQSARVEPGAMTRSFRASGNGGFLSFSGVFRSARLGYYEAYVTDRDRTVVLTFPGRTIVLSPHDPETFVEALRPTIAREALAAGE
jgi:hypothetical protein